MRSKRVYSSNIEYIQRVLNREVCYFWERKKIKEPLEPGDVIFLAEPYIVWAEYARLGKKLPVGVDPLGILYKANGPSLSPTWFSPIRMPLAYCRIRLVVEKVSLEYPDNVRNLNSHGFETKASFFKHLKLDTRGRYPGAKRASDKLKRVPHHARTWVYRVKLKEVDPFEGLELRQRFIPTAIKKRISRKPVGKMNKRLREDVKKPDFKSYFDESRAMSKERIMLGKIYEIVGLAGYECNCPDPDIGIDMEIEIYDLKNRPTGRKILLQMKSGDSYLRKSKTGTEVYLRIKKTSNIEYWGKQLHPVYLVHMNSYGLITWMEVGEICKKLNLETKNGYQFEFKAKVFNRESLINAGQTILKKIDLGAET